MLGLVPAKTQRVAANIDVLSSSEQRLDIAEL